PYYSENPYFKNSAIFFTYNKIADYNTTIQYQGINNVGSLTQKFIEQLNNNNADTPQATFDYPLGASLAFGNYLIDTTLEGGKIKYRTLVPLSANKSQNYKKVSNGYSSEYTLGWASQVEKIIYLGASIVIPVFSYNYTKTFDEIDISNNTNNNFSFLNYKEVYNSRGTGVGFKLGIIVKPTEKFRFGLSIHSPQSFYVTEDIYAELASNNEGYKNNKTKYLNSSTMYLNSSTIRDGDIEVNNYYYTSPGKIQLSSSYFWGNLKTTNSLKGFVSGELEFVNYAGTRFYANTYDKATSDYYSLINEVVKSSYKNNINFKIGSEIKLNSNWMIRGGAAYYGSPYKDETLKASRMVVSGGIGYRTNRNFIDFTIVSSSTKDAVFPYRLNDKPNTFASLTANQLVFN
ncbi:MAG: outer membrane protein transport protein, partial [Sediminibacterium sp.]|nr:outer membrane protein transport protein [Sediminibacterium sp.]